MLGGLTAIVGLFGGIFIIVYGVFRSSGEGFVAFLDYNSFVITVVGATFATILSFSFRKFVNGMKSLKEVFIPKVFPYGGTIRQFGEMAGTLRREGPVGLDRLEVNDDLMQFGVNLILSGTAEARALEAQLRPKLEVIRRDAASNQDVFAKIGGFAPAFGLIGTLIGLVAMLSTLDDPGSIGPKMAVALITTFYGVIIANMICLPLSNKIAENTNAELAYKQMIVDGLVHLLEAPDPMGLTALLMARVPLPLVAQVERELGQEAVASTA